MLFNGSVSIAAGTLDNTGYLVADDTLSVSAAEFLNRKRNAEFGRYTEEVDGGSIEVSGTRVVQEGGFVAAARLQIDAARIESLSGEFRVLGADAAQTQAKTQAYLAALRAQMGSSFTEGQAQDDIQVVFRQDRGLGVDQLVVIVAAVVVTYLTAGAGSQMMAAALNTTLSATEVAVADAAFSAMASNAVTAGVDTAVYGGSFGTAFANSFVNDLGAVATNAVGQEFAFGRGAGKTGFEEGSIFHTLAQAGVGGATQALLTNGDRDKAFLSGAVGAGMSAALGGTIDGIAGDGPAAQALVTGVASGFTAQALGLDGQAALNAGLNEAFNNRRTDKQQAIVAGARSCIGANCLNSLGLLRGELNAVNAKIVACDATPGSCSPAQQTELNGQRNDLMINREQVIRRGIDQGVISGANPPSDYFAGLAGIGYTGTGLAFTRLTGTAKTTNTPTLAKTTGEMSTVDGAKGAGEIENAVLGRIRTGSATKTDPLHSFPNMVDNYVGDATKFSIPTKGPGGVVVRQSELYQVEVA